MKKSVVGVEDVSYINKDGKAVKGVRVYVATPLTSPHTGISVKDEFINGADVRDYPLGDILAVLYEPTFKGNYRCTGILYDNAKK